MVSMVERISSGVFKASLFKRFWRRFQYGSRRDMSGGCQAAGRSSIHGPGAYLTASVQENQAAFRGG
jgi:hypothetical protein